jgi:protein-tyrosine-phosphatase
MAEVIARQRATTLGWSRIEFRSVGIEAFDGSPASGGATRVAGAHGLDLDDHSATRLTPEEASAADLILTMSSSQLLRVIELGGGDRAAMLTAFAGGHDGFGPISVPDPVGGPDEEYEETFRLLDELIGRVLDRLESVVAP